MQTVFPKVGIFISNLQIEHKELKILPMLTEQTIRGVRIWQPLSSSSSTKTTAVDMYHLFFSVFLYRSYTFKICLPRSGFPHDFFMHVWFWLIILPHAHLLPYSPFLLCTPFIPSIPPFHFVLLPSPAPPVSHGPFLDFWPLSTFSPT